jgi:hypothetical protein
MIGTTAILSKIKIAVVVLSVAALVISGCTLPLPAGPGTPTQALSFPTFEATFTPSDASSGGIVQLTPTSADSTAQPVAAAATNTLLPPTAEPPTAVPPTAVPPTAIPPTAIPPTAVPPTPIPGPVPVRISFATGATAGVVTGVVEAGKYINYIVGASQGQPLIISTDSPKNDVTFSVTGLRDGVTLLGSAQKLSSWQTMLSVTQDYLVRVIGGASNAKFTLNVITPARIFFDPGAISANRTGSTPGGWAVSYVLRASANQKMDINLGVTSGTAVLSVYGYQDGQPYLRSVVEATTFSLKLPATQDYIIQIVPKAGMVATYSINIAIK